MATYLEISAINEDAAWNAFLSKVRVATAVKAAAIIDSTLPTVIMLDWAKSAISRPHEAGNQLVNYIIAVNKAASVVVMLAASDTAIQNNINDAVDAMYAG